MDTKREIDALMKLKGSLDEECKKEREKNYQMQVQMQTLSVRDNVSFYIPTSSIGLFTRKEQIRNEDQGSSGRDFKIGTNVGRTITKK